MLVVNQEFLTDTLPEEPTTPSKFSRTPGNNGNAKWVCVEIDGFHNGEVGKMHARVKFLSFIWDVVKCEWQQAKTNS